MEPSSKGIVISSCSSCEEDTISNSLERRWAQSDLPGVAVLCERSKSDNRSHSRVTVITYTHVLHPEKLIASITSYRSHIL